MNEPFDGSNDEVENREVSNLNELEEMTERLVKKRKNKKDIKKTKKPISKGAVKEGQEFNYDDEIK